jgi:hypothetical protein
MPSFEQSKKGGSKRKIQAKGPVSRKKAKIQHHTADDLPWKIVSRPSEAGRGGDDGILELEEVDDVEVVYEETQGGRVVKFNVSSVTSSLLLMSPANIDRTRSFKIHQKSLRSVWILNWNLLLWNWLELAQIK